MSRPRWSSKSFSASQSIHDLSMLAAERVLPWVTTAGTVMPIGPSPIVSLKLSTISPTTAATFFGVDFVGVVMRSRSVIISPACRSTGAPLMPLPPISIPSAGVCSAVLSVMVGSLSTSRFFGECPCGQLVWPLAAGARPASAPQLTQAPRVEHWIEAEGVGEVEPVEPAVHLNPVANVVAALLRGQRLQPHRIRSRVRVRLQFEEHHSAGDVHGRITVDRVRAEVSDARDDPPVRAGVDVGVRWTHIAVNQRRAHHSVGQVGMQATPSLADVGQVALELGSACAYWSIQHVVQQLPEGAELPRRLRPDQPGEPRNRAR